MTSVTRTLAIARHATAESLASDDAERALTARGRDEAAAAGRWLSRERGFRPDAALVSGAVRTRTTWTLLAEAAEYQITARVDDALRTAEEEAALDLIRATSEDVRSLIVVGHNPTVSHVAALLDDGDGDAAAMHAMIGGFPPGAVALFRVSGSWSELTFSGARLEAFRPGARA